MYYNKMTCNNIESEKSGGLVGPFVLHLTPIPGDSSMSFPEDCNPILMQRLWKRGRKQDSRVHTGIWSSISSSSHRRRCTCAGSSSSARCAHYICGSNIASRRRLQKRPYTGFKLYVVLYIQYISLSLCKIQHIAKLPYNYPVGFVH